MNINQNFSDVIVIRPCLPCRKDQSAHCFFFAVEKTEGNKVSNEREAKRVPKGVDGKKYFKSCECLNNWEWLALALNLV